MLIGVVNEKTSVVITTYKLACSIQMFSWCMEQESSQHCFACCTSKADLYPYFANIVDTDQMAPSVL